MPTFALNKKVTLAERYGFDFALSMIKLRGFGGKSEFWEHNLESFTLMAGLAAVTARIKIFATAPTLTMPPAIVARMASTIDSIAPGRFGINLITGWQKAGIRPDGPVARRRALRHRYNYLAEYAPILRELWETGVSDFKGQYFTMTDCRVSPRPQRTEDHLRRPSDEGLAFTAQYADYNFCARQGHQHADAPAPTGRPPAAAKAKTGRNVASYILFMIIADETDEEAMAKWELYGTARTRRRWPGWSTRPRPTQRPASNTNVRHSRRPGVGGEHQHGHAGRLLRKVARMLDEVATVPGMAGVLLAFDDFVKGTEISAPGSSR